MLKYQLYAVVEMACTADTLALHTFIWTNLFATSKCFLSVGMIMFV